MRDYLGTSNLLSKDKESGSLEQVTRAIRDGTRDGRDLIWWRPWESRMGSHGRSVSSYTTRERLVRQDSRPSRQALGRGAVSDWPL